MLQILYEQDHLNRAKTLADVTPGAKYDLVTSDPVRRQGMDTILFWGHSGGNLSLCGQTPAQIKSIVKRWKTLNSSVNTVEILTCDGRHAQRGQEPLVRKIKSELRSGILSSTRKVVVKALPVAVAGSEDSASILLADWETKSWCYISAPSTGAMFTVKNKIVTIAEKFYCLRDDDKSSADVAQASQRLFKQVGEQDRVYSLNYGYFATLRAQLGVVRSRDFTVKSRLNQFTQEQLDELDDEDD